MIFSLLEQQLVLLQDLLSKLDNHRYTQKIAHLGGVSIGSHTRHVIELLRCAVDGYHIGQIDYVNRKRDLLLENNRQCATFSLLALLQEVRRADKLLELVMDGDASSVGHPVSTTYFREIVYNTEHVIHHLALIKVALIDMRLDIVDRHFGMAYATIKYQASMAKS